MSEKSVQIIACHEGDAFPKFMDYPEREFLKEFGLECVIDNDVRSAACMLTIISHWHRDGSQIDFMSFAKNWVSKNKDRKDIQPFLTDNLIDCFLV